MRSMNEDVHVSSARISYFHLFTLERRAPFTGWGGDNDDMNGRRLGFRPC